MSLARTYSPETWDLYDELDRSLDPAGPDTLLDLAAEYLTPGARILDAGCRDAAYLVRLVERHEATGTAVDPVAVHIARARENVAASGLSHSIEVFHGTVEALPTTAFDLIWCRDVLEQVAALDAFTHATARLLAPGGRVLAYTSVVTDLLEPGEAAMLRKHMGNVHENLYEPRLLTAFADAGLTVERRIPIGTEWREWAEERTRPASESLLRLSRLRRRRDEIIARHGVEIYEHAEANLHWLPYQCLGKLEPVVYVLAGPRPSTS